MQNSVKSFYPDMRRKRRYSDVTIASATRSDIVIFGINFLFFSKMDY